jgi:hypothetical protein
VVVFLGAILKGWATAGYFVTWRLRMRISKCYLDAFAPKKFHGARGDGPCTVGVCKTLRGIHWKFRQKISVSKKAGVPFLQPTLPTDNH